MNVFAERLKELRTEGSLTTTMLGNAIGVSSTTISRWELKKRIPNIENLIALAKFFKVSTDYLCGMADC